MRCGAFVLLFLILLSSASSVTAQDDNFSNQDLELDWEYDFGETYISTKPLI